MCTYESSEDYLLSHMYTYLDQSVKDKRIINVKKGRQREYLN